MKYSLIVLAFLAISAWGAEHIAGMTTLDFITHCDRLDQLSGAKIKQADTLSEAERQQHLKQADAIVAGYAFYNRTEPILIGKKDIDWFGGQKKHQEWIAQLNRFFMLEPLGIAYQMTGEEQYARRARELIGDYQYFLEVKHQNQFFDAQKNNRLNLSLRINSWISGLRRLGKSAAFDDRFVADMLRTLTRQIQDLNRITVPGAQNFYAAQSDALIIAALSLPHLPEMDEVLKHGIEVFSQSIQMQFRPDGTQVENSAGYQLWMTSLAAKYRRMAEYDPRLQAGLTTEQLMHALEFCYLAMPLGINDSQVSRQFPKFNRDTVAYRKLAEQFRLPDFKSPLRHSFADARLYFAGNENEALFFDATGGFAAGHQHHARLNLLYAAHGYQLIVDHGMRNYEESSPLHRAGKETASHATVHPDRLVQYNLPESAQTLLAVNEPDFACFSGVYTANYGEWGKLGQKNPPVIRARHFRSIIWLPGEYLLIRDTLHGPEVAKAGVWNFNFPVPDQEDDTLDAVNGVYRTRNRQRANFVLQTVEAPGKQFELIRYYGQKEPVYRGWRGNYGDGKPMPLLSFQAKHLQDGARAEFLVAARPAGDAPPQYRVLRCGNGVLELLRPDGGRDLWLDRGATSEVLFDAERLLLRSDAAGRRQAVFGVKLRTFGQRSFASPVTGFIRDSNTREPNQSNHNNERKEVK